MNKVLDDMWVATKENPYETPKKKQRCGKMSHEIEAELEGEDDDDGEEVDDSGDNSDIKVTSDNQLSDDRKPDWMFVGYVAFVLFSPFGDNVAMKRALDFTMFDRDPPSSEKRQYGRAYVREEEKKIAAFERSREENRGVSRIEKLIMENQKIQLENQKLMIERMKREDVQDRIAALNAEATIIEKQLELALRRAEITKDFSRVDELEKEFDDIKKKIQIEGKFHPYKFPTSTD